METVTVDRKGRVTIPRDVRDSLGLEEAEELSIAVERGEIRLRPVVKPQVKVKARRKWGKEAFLPAGEALVGGED